MRCERLLLISVATKNSANLYQSMVQTIIDEKIKPFANKKIIEYLGMQEDELLSAIIDHIRAHQGAQGLVTELEPVLAEEAEEFTYKICEYT